MRKLFTLAAFCLATLALNAQESADYIIRTLTFEDADFKGTTPTFSGGDNWSSLIDDPQYGGQLLYGSGAGVSSIDEAYKWTDENNTWLSNVPQRATAPGATGAEVMPYPITLRPISKPMAASTLS